MTATTRNLLVVSILMFVVSLGVFSYALYTLHSQTTRFAELKTAEQTSHQKEETYLSLTRMVELTAKDRAEIDEYFITERAAVSYIAEIESLARFLGLEIETTELNAVLPNSKEKQLAGLQAGFKVAGPQLRVEEFMRRIESAPYHQVVSDITITREVEGGGTEGTVRLRVTTI